MDSSYSQKCLIHPSSFLECVYLNLDANSLRVCHQCLQDEEIPIKKTISIKDLLSKPENSVIRNYPPFPNSQISEAMKKLQEPVNIELTQIDKFFSDLLSEFQEKIEKAKSNVKENITKLFQVKQTLIDTYSKVCAVKDLQNAVTSNDPETEIRKVLQDVFQKAQYLQDQLLPHLRDLKKLKSEMNFEKPQIIAKNILNQIQSIEFWPNSQAQEDTARISCTPQQQKQEPLQSQSPLSQKQSSQPLQQSSYQLKPSLFTSVSTDTSSGQLSPPSQRQSLPAPLLQQVDSQEQNENSLLSSINLIPSIKWNSSKWIRIGRNDESQLEALRTDAYNYNFTQFYFDFTLKSSLKYVFLIEQCHKSDQNSYFGVGLIPDEKKDEAIQEHRMLFFEGNNEFGMNKMIKGKQVHSGEDSKNLKRTLEVRVNLQSKLLRVGTYPNYDSVVELTNPQKIRSHLAYRLCFILFYPKEFIRILEVKTVKQFDDRMSKNILD